MNSSLKSTVLLLPSQMWNNLLHCVIILPNDVLYNGNSPQKNVSESVLVKSKLALYVFKGLSPQVLKSILLMDF